MGGSEAALQDGFQFSSTFSHPVIRAGVTHCWLIRFGFCATHSKCVSHSVLADLAAGVSVTPISQRGARGLLEGHSDGPGVGHRAPLNVGLSVLELQSTVHLMD